MTQVVFACVHNAGRSQMAAALLTLLADPTKVRGVSAGTQPGARVHPEVLLAMRELGVDLEGVQPQLLTAAMVAASGFLITMGCGEACPVAPPSVQRLDWPLEDKGQDHGAGAGDPRRGAAARRGADRRAGVVAGELTRLIRHSSDRRRPPT